jgi:hypothetical protein
MSPETVRRPLTERQRRVFTAMHQMGAKGRLGEWVTAQAIGERIKMPPVIRHGRGAHGPRSWSGFQSEGFVLASTMRSLVHRGLVESCPDPRDPRPKDLYRLK